MNTILYPRYKFFYSRFKNKKFTLLDVGCGNQSPSKTRKLFKYMVYHGIDTTNYNNTSEDFATADRFFQLDLDKDRLDEVPNEFYDVILMSHVIEHLRNGTEVLAQLTHKLRIGGVIYIEFPGVRSLSLPSITKTHFSDDSTHVRIYDVKEVSNVLLDHHCQIIRAGTRRHPERVLLFPVILAAYLLTSLSFGTAFWDVLGFADYVFAMRVADDSLS